MTNCGDKLDSILAQKTIARLQSYDSSKYLSDVECLGLQKTWQQICFYLLNSKESDHSYKESSRFLQAENFDELYEAGLALENKQLKRKSGQYYTPDDVALLMCEWLAELPGEVVCDVACGTGKLILTYLNLIGFEAARDLLLNKKVYLYDDDETALMVCQCHIALKYGKDSLACINVISGDFLAKHLVLPANSKVISNPPYAKISEFSEAWNLSAVVLESKEYYAAFMEKIISEAHASVIITPFSFISGKKYYSLRKSICEQSSGFIVSFDNVPGNIFRGKKHGIFNSNTANSVRAAITVSERKYTEDKLKQVKDNYVKKLSRNYDKQELDYTEGYRISPLIRFKNEEREDLLEKRCLEATLPKFPQNVDAENRSFKKLDKDFLDIYSAWVEKSEYKLSHFLKKNKGNYFLHMPNTCRYYTVASPRKLKRKGALNLYFNDEDAFYFIYAMLNSSFAYWWWRIYDGSILYTKSLLKALPLPYNLLSKEDKEFFKQKFFYMKEEEQNFVVSKLNAGVVQENIKFPEHFRDTLNAKILEILGVAEEAAIFHKIHANKFF